MLSCANCVKDALYYVDEPGANPVYYCSDCLPASLKGRADAGQFRLAPAAPVEEPATTKASRKAAVAAVDTTPVVDATITADATVIDSSVADASN